MHGHTLMLPSQRLPSLSMSLLVQTANPIIHMHVVEIKKTLLLLHQLATGVV